MKLTGRVALVLGGSSGIGRACVDALASDGAAVVVADVNDAGGDQAVADVNAAGGTAAFVHTTIMEEESVADSVRLAVDTFGGLNILVTSVAGRPPEELRGGPDGWKYMVDMFQTGPYYASRQALPAIIESGNGSVIHIASIAGIRGSLIGDVDTTAYPTAKHGVVGLTKSLALHYGPKGVRVNCDLPRLHQDPGDQAALRGRHRRRLRPRHASRAAAALGTTRGDRYGRILPCLG